MQKKVSSFHDGEAFLFRSNGDGNKSRQESKRKQEATYINHPA